MDHLTGLVSRSFFPPGGGAAVQLYRRNGLPLACAVLDVDEALRCVGRVLHESTRADDVVARYRGRGLRPVDGRQYEDAIEVAERMRRGVERESVTGNGSFFGSAITVSVGVAALPESILKSLEQEFVEKAEAMSCTGQKKSGKNGVAAAGRR